MGVASTVSRLPITVKVVPLTPNEEEGGGERQQQQGEQEEEEQTSQTQVDEEAAQTGNVCFYVCAPHQLFIRNIQSILGS